MWGANGPSAATATTAISLRGAVSKRVPRQHGEITVVWSTLMRPNTSAYVLSCEPVMPFDVGARIGTGEECRGQISDDAAAIALRCWMG